MKTRMGTFTWRRAVDIVKPYVVKVRTPRGSGTGFLCAYAAGKELCAIATAGHVITESHDWEEPLRIQHYTSGKTRFLRASDRVILIDQELDLAVILFYHKNIPFPKRTLKFIPEKKHCRVGVEIGWVGFPSVHPTDLCFFTGRNSCWINNKRIYLVDGVAINGVSGGPAFYPSRRGILIIGSVSAYLPNRIGATPGLAVISDVDYLLKVIKKLKSLDEARKKETPPGEPKKEEPDRNNQE